MSDDSNEIIFDHILAIRVDIAGLRDSIRELQENVIAARDEVHAIRVDFRRQERAIESVQASIDRIKDHLNPNDIE